ncbi:hypothetical protein A2U01_0075040, partial [Trifolium medium]|nr:hypothetical protein [Trifolium medium]
MGLLSGPNAPSGVLRGGDKDAPAADDGLGVIQPTSSQTAPTATSGDAPSLWDPLFNPLEFIERELNMVGDISRFTSASIE